MKRSINKTLGVLAIAVISAIVIGLIYFSTTNLNARAVTVNGPRISGTGDINHQGSAITWDNWGYENGGPLAKPDYAVYDSGRLSYYDSATTRCNRAVERNTDIVTYLTVPEGATTVQLELGCEQWYDCSIGNLVMYCQWEISAGSGNVDGNGKVTGFTGGAVTTGNQYVRKNGGYGGRNTDTLNVTVQGGQLLRVSLKNWFTGSGTTTYFRAAVYIDKLIATFGDAGAGPSAPTTVTADAEPSVGQWYTRDVTLTVGGAVDYDGVQKYQYSTDNGATWQDCIGADKNKVVVSQTNQNNYRFRAVDEDGNGDVYEYNKIFYIDKAAPVIGNFTGQDTPAANQVRVTFTITDEGSGIASKSCSLNGVSYSIMSSGSSFYFNAKANGTYTITATDRAGNTTTQNVTVTGLDNDAPVISDITGADAVSLYEGKTITFRVTDKNGVASVTFDNVLITPVDGVYSATVNKNGTYRVTYSDSLGNTGARDIQVTNCYFGTITAGAGVTITGLTPEGYVAENGTITVKVISNNFGQKLVLPAVANATVVENYNYGLEAEYTVTFSGNADYTQTINAKYEAVNITVQVNGTTQVFAFGSVQTFTANEPQSNQRFVGWYNSAGVLISTDRIVSVTITSANAYAPRYINVDETMITYLNLAGWVIDIKGVKLGGQTLEQYIASQTAVSAPVNAYMEFAGWRVVSDQDGEAVVQATYDRTNDLFNVTVDGVTNQYGYNERVYLTGESTTIGWAINGQMVSNSKDYTFFVNNDVTITSVTSGQSVEQEARQIAVTSTNGTYVITGLFTAGKEYDEVGFVFADGSIKDEYITMANTLVTVRPVYTIHPVTNQIVINVDMATYGSKKVRLYTRTGNEISYSNVITLV